MRSWFRQRRAKLGGETRHAAATVGVALAAMALLLATLAAGRSAAAAYWEHAGSAGLGDQIDAQAVTRALRDLLDATHARPDVASYWRVLAGAVSASDPERARGYAQRAVILQPSAAANWDSLGLIYFQLGNGDAALAALRQAVAHDPSGETAHWQLANLAFALGATQTFWDQLQVTANVMDGSLAGSVLLAAERAGASPTKAAGLLRGNAKSDVRDEAILFFVHRAQLRAATGLFLRWRGCADAIPIAVCQDAELQLLKALTAAALRSGRDAGVDAAGAAQAWNHGLEEGLFHGTNCTQGHVANGDFVGRNFLGTLCSWQRPRQVEFARVAAAGRPGGRALRLMFQGGDGEQGRLTGELLWLRAGQPYVLTVWVRGSRKAEPSGLTATLRTPAGRVVAHVAVPLGTRWKRIRLDLPAESRSQVVGLEFSYSRPLGQIPLQGWVELSSVALSALTAAQARGG